jgi:hypothetical protein
MKSFLLSFVLLVFSFFAFKYFIFKTFTLDIRDLSLTILTCFTMAIVFSFLDPTCMKLLKKWFRKDIE